MSYIPCSSTSPQVWFYLIDGTIYYEREEFEEDAEHVLRIVLQTFADNSTSPTSKSFVTGRMITMDVRISSAYHLTLSNNSTAQSSSIKLREAQQQAARVEERTAS